MENLNTPHYWDEQFEIEWKAIYGKKYADGGSGYRWDGDRFEMIGSKMPLRGRLLDVGCGLGNFCRFIKARNFLLDVWGVDFSAYAIKKAKKITDNVNYVVSDAYNLPFENYSFDFITAQEIIEHLNEPIDFLKELKRVVKPGGIVFLTTPWRGITNKQGVLSEEHIQEWIPREFLKLIEPYFPKGELIFPKVYTDNRGKIVRMNVWFLVICQLY